ncbi:MAG: hypothetical protein QNJ51_07995 [Calothrix sp. MO_167.B12]|nr:hypothetical protein [Calothrix sp. MO_167.B12]
MLTQPAADLVFRGLKTPPRIYEKLDRAIIQALETITQFKILLVGLPTVATILNPTENRHPIFQGFGL